MSIFLIIALPFKRYMSSPSGRRGLYQNPSRVTCGNCALLAPFASRHVRVIAASHATLRRLALTASLFFGGCANPLDKLECIQGETVVVTPEDCVTIRSRDISKPFSYSLGCQSYQVTDWACVILNPNETRLFSTGARYDIHPKGECTCAK